MINFHLSLSLLLSVSIAQCMENYEVAPKSLATLYTWTSGEDACQLLPSNNELVGSDLKSLFDQCQVTTGFNLFSGSPSRPWNEEDWKLASTKLMRRMEKHKEKSGVPVHLNELPKLLLDAKCILKSFLPATNEIQSLEWRCRQKTIRRKNMQLRRLFTYAKLQQVIEEQKLSHVHLPSKFLVVKDKTTGQYVTSECASEILDDAIKAFVFIPRRLFLRIDYYSTNYELYIFAEEQMRHTTSLSTAAFDDLKKLIEKVPFDVGTDNIFTTSNGDAMIIDTEFKGESVARSIAKLNNRYRNV